jgi:hypothetical protein
MGHICPSVVENGTIQDYICKSFQFDIISISMVAKIQGFVHYSSIANPLKILNISFCSLLFVDPLKFQEHIGIIVASLRVKTGAFPCSQGNLKTCDNMNSGA